MDSCGVIHLLSCAKHPTLWNRSQNQSDAVPNSFSPDRWNACIELLARPLHQLNAVQRPAALVDNALILFDGSAQSIQHHVATQRRRIGAQIIQRLRLTLWPLRGIATAAVNRAANFLARPRRLRVSRLSSSKNSEQCRKHEAAESAEPR